MRHQIVHDHPPVFQTAQIHLEQTIVQQQIKHVLLPGFPRVLVAAQAGQQFRARVKTGHVSGRVRPQIGHDIAHKRGEDVVHFVFFGRTETNVQNRGEDLGQYLLNNFVNSEIVEKPVSEYQLGLDTITGIVNDVRRSS